MTTQDSSIYWKRGRVELRAAGFDPDRAAQTNAVVTIASAYTNAHRCNNRVRAITDLLVDILAERGGQGLIVGAPAVSDALTQGTPTAGYSLASRDVVADCFEIGHYAHHGDAMIVISGCDKTGAAALMPLARTNAFGLVLYPGTGTPGRVSFGAWASKGNNHYDSRLRRGARRQRVRPPFRRGIAGSRAQRDAGQRHLWRDVHGQHHEHDRGIDRHDAAARRLASRRLQCRQRHPCRRPRAGARLGRCPVPADGGRYPAARHHDRAGVRERDHDRLCDGRFDQHVSASARGRARGAGADHDRAHPSRSASASRCWPICSRMARSRWAACMRSAACRL